MVVNNEFRNSKSELKSTSLGQPDSVNELNEMKAHPAGLISATGCSCMVSSPNFVNAAPAAEKISPT